MLVTRLKKPQKKTVLNGLVTTGYLCKLFNRSALTVNNWRRYEGMPFVEIPGDDRVSIRYDLEEILAWARHSGKRRFLTAVEAEENGEVRK